MQDKFETFEHGADTGVRGRGKTLEEAFANVAKAVFSLMFDLVRIKPRQEISVVCDAPDMDTLLLVWLNQLIALADLEKLALSEFHVTIVDLELKGTAKGEPIDAEKHDLGVEVKGATYTMLRTYKENDDYVAQCVVDV